MKRLKKLYKDEVGGMSLLMFAVIFFGILMFILLFNFFKVFAVDHQADTAAQQSSLAATGVVYEKAMDVIERYWYPCGIDKICYLIEDYEKTKSTITDSHLTEIERHRKAVDQVLMNRMSADLKLKKQILGAMNRAEEQMQGVVQNVIRENHGKVSGTEIVLFNQDNRIEVRTSAEFESSEVPSFMKKMKEDLPQVGVGVEVSFINALNRPTRIIQLP